MADKTHHDTRTAPSGRGIAVPAHAVGKYQQDYPILPIPFGIVGARGMPSTEFSVNASRLMQSVMGPDDIAYYKATAGDAPYDVERQYSHGGGPFLTSMGTPSQGEVMWALQQDDDDDDVRVDETLRTFIRLALAEAHDRGPETDDEEETHEASGAGAVAGYTAPLGTAPKVPGTKKKRQPAWSVAGRAYGGAKLV